MAAATTTTKRLSLLLVLVFCLLCSVLGQEGSFQDLIGQGEGFSSTLEEAKKALGAANEVASTQGALDDYLGDGGDAGSSLAGLLDSAESHASSGSPPATDSPVGSPEDLPAADSPVADADTAASPAPATEGSSAGAPQSSPTGAPQQAPANAPASTSPSYAPSKAPAAESPEGVAAAPTTAKGPAPEESEEDDPLDAPAGAPVEFDDEDEDVDDDKFATPPAEAPNGQQDGEDEDA